MTSVAVWLGTLILFVPTPRGAFVSADSRHDGGDPAKHDQARKIFLCGRAAVCAVSGGLRLDASTEEAAGTLDVSASLERTSARMRESENQSAAVLFETLRTSMPEEIREFWRKFLAGRRVDAPMSLRLGAPSVCTILFVAPGFVAQMQFPFTERRLADGTWTHELREPVVRRVDAMRPLAQGHTECLLTPAKLPDSADGVEELYAPARETPFCRDVIGGPVDIAAIEDGEARWVQRKAELAAVKPLAAQIHSFGAEGFSPRCHAVYEYQFTPQAPCLKIKTTRSPM